MSLERRLILVSSTDGKALQGHQGPPFVPILCSLSNFPSPAWTPQLTFCNRKHSLQNHQLCVAHPAFPYAKGIRSMTIQRDHSEGDWKEKKNKSLVSFINLPETRPAAGAQHPFVREGWAILKGPKRL